MTGNIVNCAAATDNELVERYVGGTLSAAEAAAFEEHLLICAACQDSLELGLALRRALAPPASHLAVRRERRRLATFLLAAASIVVVAAGIGMARRSSRSPAKEVAAVPLDAPLYLGAPVRAPSSVDSMFGLAMARYAAGSYTAAAEMLSRIVVAGNGAPPVYFFRGASNLMIGRARDARDDFTRVIDAQDATYAAEARYYRARAFLMLNDRAAAIADLRAVQPNDERVGARVRELTQRLEGPVARSR